VALALVVGIIQLVGTWAGLHTQPEARPLDLLGWVLVLAGPVLLVARRRYRIPVLIAITIVTIAYFSLGYMYGPAFLAMLVAALGAISAGYRRAVAIVCAIGYLVYVGLGHLVPTLLGVQVRVPGLGNALGLGIWLVLTLAMGEALRVRSVHFAEVARTRAERDRARAEQQRRQDSEERLRIAQELHDVLGHHLSLISVQAGVGLHLMDERPEQARTALLAIKQASAEALREVRSVLGVLRAEDERAPRAPAPSLADLSALVDNPSTKVDVQGSPRPLPAELDRAAYRILQEALTNVRRHAGTAATATVTIGYRPAELLIRVDDDGPGVPEPGVLTRPGVSGRPGVALRSGVLPRSGAATRPGATRSGAAARSGGTAGADGAAGSGVASGAGAVPGSGVVGVVAGAGEPAGDGGNLPLGNGIPGMRARAGALGGTLSAGAGPAGGFRVEARLPLDPAAPPSSGPSPSGPSSSGGSAPVSAGSASAAAGSASAPASPVSSQAGPVSSQASPVSSQAGPVSASAGEASYGVVSGSADSAPAATDKASAGAASASASAGSAATGKPATLEGE
jgi:signal transduction histidine kinase